MDGNNPGGLYGESGSSMEVADKCYDDVEVMCIDSRGRRAPFLWNGGMGLGTKREVPELGTGGFLPAMEDDSVILGKDSDRCFFEEDAAAVVTNVFDAHQVVMEVRHYVTDLDGELREEQVT